MFLKIRAAAENLQVGKILPLVALSGGKRGQKEWPIETLSSMHFSVAEEPNLKIILIQLVFLKQSNVVSSRLLPCFD